MGDIQAGHPCMGGGGRHGGLLRFSSVHVWHDHVCSAAPGVARGWLSSLGVPLCVPLCVPLGVPLCVPFGPRCCSRLAQLSRCASLCASLCASRCASLCASRGASQPVAAVCNVAQAASDLALHVAPCDAAVYMRCLDASTFAPWLLWRCHVSSTSASSVVRTCLSSAWGVISCQVPELAFSLARERSVCYNKDAAVSPARLATGCRVLQQRQGISRSVCVPSTTRPAHELWVCSTAAMQLRVHYGCETASLLTCITTSERQRTELACSSQPVIDSALSVVHHNQ